MITTRTTLTTIDGVTIVGDFSMPKGAAKAVLLLHMMPATRESFSPLAQALNKTGVATLAIDLRGHGESTMQGNTRLNFATFSDRHHQASRLDVDVALNFLKSKGFEEQTISFVGASVGANLSIDALSRYAKTSAAVLISPGLDYRGIKIEASLKNTSASQRIWLVSSEGDSYSADSVRTLNKLRPDITQLTFLSGRDHGTALFKSHPTLIGDIMEFLTK